jgi:hypothetical protein
VNSCLYLFEMLAPEVGLEPTTLRLTAALEGVQFDGNQRLTNPSITSRSQRSVHRVTTILTYLHPVRSHIGHMDSTGANICLAGTHTSNKRVARLPSAFSLLRFPI